MRSLHVRLALVLVCGYQTLVRPILPAACRFVPSCSEYYRQALMSFGFLRATGMALGRITRCHPWHEGGYDPPPSARPVHRRPPGA